MRTEPLLTSEDLRIWARIERGARAHAKTVHHRHMLDEAKRAVGRMCRRCPDAYVAWSTGKDSTALTHLVCVEMGVACDVMSIRDDTDYPGEEEYIERLAAQWGIRVEVLRPPFSVLEWVRTHGLGVDEDIFARGTPLAEESFFQLIDEYCARRGCGDAYLGLRAEESKGRRANFRFRGHVYTKRAGVTICQPLAAWSVLDVYAYLISRDIEMLHIYHCVRMRPDPLSIREDWWLMGQFATDGDAVWLRTYWPSLWRRLIEIAPGMGVTG